MATLISQLGGGRCRRRNAPWSAPTASGSYWCDCDPDRCYFLPRPSTRYQDTGAGYVDFDMLHEIAAKRGTPQRHEVVWSLEQPFTPVATVQIENADFAGETPTGRTERTLGSDRTIIHTGVPLAEKLDVFDRHADEAVDHIKLWLETNRTELLTVARARHITGHYVHGDGNFMEWTSGRMRSEAAQEIADAIVYVAQLLHRAEGPKNE